MQDGLSVFVGGVDVGASLDQLVDQLQVDLRPNVRCLPEVRKMLDQVPVLCTL